MDCIRAHDLTRYVACASCCNFGSFASRFFNLHQTKIDWLGNWILYWTILLIYSIYKCCCRVEGVFFFFFPVVGRKKTSCFRMQRRSLNSSCFFFFVFNWVYGYSWVKFEFIIVFKLIYDIFTSYKLYLFNFFLNSSGLNLFIGWFILLNSWICF
jgi:hypothetical protein